MVEIKIMQRQELNYFFLKINLSRISAHDFLTIVSQNIKFLLEIAIQQISNQINKDEWNFFRKGGT